VDFGQLEFGPRWIVVGLHDKLPQLYLVKPPRLVSEAVKQPADVDAEVVESRLAVGASIQIRQKQGRVLNGGSDIVRANDTLMLQVSQEEMFAMESKSVSVAKVDAWALPQVATKPLNRLFSQIGHESVICEHGSGDVELPI